MVSQATKERAEALRLSSEQLEVLRHLRTFRVSTADIVRETFFQAGTS